MAKESLGSGQPIPLGHTPIRLGRPQSAKIGTGSFGSGTLGPSLRGGGGATDVSHAVRVSLGFSYAAITDEAPW